MKKIFFTLVVVIATTLTAQVGINTTSPDETAMLEVVSTTKGVLFPTMTEEQRDAIQNPAIGLIIFNMSDKRLQMNIGTRENPIWETFSMGCCKTNTGLNTELKCNTLNKQGNYEKGKTLTASNNITLDVNVIALATDASQNQYTISTNTVNGYSFSASGTFTQTGVQTITLQGSGAPINTGTDNFTLSFNNKECHFTIQVTETVKVGSPMFGSSSSLGSPAYFAKDSRWSSSDLGAGNSWSAMVYDKNLIGTSGTITSISFLIDHGSQCQYTTSNQKIYMKLVDYGSFSNSSNEDASQMTEVFSGDVTWIRAGYGVPEENGFTTIDLETPFPYDNSKSLLIYYVNEYGGEAGCLNSFGAAGPGFIVDNNGNSTGTKVSKYAKYGNGVTPPSSAYLSSNQTPVIKIDFN